MQNNIQSTDLTYDTNIAQINTNQSYHFSSTQNRQQHYFYRLGMTHLDNTDDSIQTMSSLGDDDVGTEMEAKSTGRYSFPLLMMMLYTLSQQQL